MFREIMNAVLACVVTFLICAVGYPAVVYGVGHTLFPSQAEGSLIERDGKIVGSVLIAQPFSSEKYFSPRPSAAGPTGYAADAASGSNLGTTNPALNERIALDVARQIALKTGDTDLIGKLKTLDDQLGELKTMTEKKEADEETTKKLEAVISESRAAVVASSAELGKTATNLVPVDLVTASGAGLDPHISPEAARYQAERVAKARGVLVERVLDLINKHVETSGFIIGAPARVNVLLLNLALDKEVPTTMPGVAFVKPTVETDNQVPIAHTSVAEVKSARPAPPSAIETLSQRLDKLQERVEAAPIDQLSTDFQRLKDQVTKLAATDNTVKRMAELDERVSTHARDMQLIRADLKATRESLAPVMGLPAIAKDLQALRLEVETLRTTAKTAERSSEKPSVAANIGAAAKLFRERQFPAAAVEFRTLATANPDDARIWYYSALTNSLTTGLWTGLTEELVLKGVERERVGTPTTQEINSEFAFQTKENGREWLAFYRQRAAKP